MSDPDYNDTFRLISEDKKFIVSYEMNQYDSERTIAVKWEESGLSCKTNIQKQFPCADWFPDFAITPGKVREVIEWCLSAINASGSTPAERQAK